MRLADFTLTESDSPHVAQLSKQHSEVLALFRENPNYEAMAAALNVPVGTIKSRLNRARSKVLKMRAKAEAAAVAAELEAV